MDCRVHLIAYEEVDAFIATFCLLRLLVMDCRVHLFAYEEGYTVLCIDEMVVKGNYFCALVRLFVWKSNTLCFTSRNGVKARFMKMLSTSCLQ